MEEQIQLLIEKEIERRVDLKVTQVLGVISKTYDVSLQRLLKDASSVDPVAAVEVSGRKQCLGLIATGHRCNRFGGVNGYCKIHQSQAPVVRSLAPPAMTIVQHTHSLPPLFLAGCPACEQQNRSRLNV
jgi:hypothetical protein